MNALGRENSAILLVIKQCFLRSATQFREVNNSVEEDVNKYENAESKF